MTKVEVEAEIEVTAAMIEAGVREYALFDSQDPGEAVVAAIYRAMRPLEVKVDEAGE